MPLDIRTQRAAVLAVPLASGLFTSVAGHEPKAPPQRGLTAALWIQELRPIPPRSGLAVTSALVRWWLRINLNMLHEPQDDIDELCTNATTHLINEYTGGFTLGGAFGSGGGNIDLLGAHGEPLGAVGGHIPMGNQMMRVMTVNIPCVCNDVFEQEA